MNNRQTGFSAQALALSVGTAAAAEFFAAGAIGSVRAWLGWNFLGALALVLLSRLVCQSVPGRGQAVACAALAVWLAAELLQTALQAQRVCRQEFSTMAWIGLLPLLLWAGWHWKPELWNAPARILWWFVGFGAAVFLLGMAGQLHWERLFGPEMFQRPTTPVYAEYFAVPFLCGQPQQKKAVRLPLLGFAVQAALTLEAALLFGTRTYPAKELLRVWSLGTFSRLDAFLMLIWLACAMLRVCMLSASIRLLCRRLPFGKRGVCPDA